MKLEVLLTGSFGVGKSSIFNRFIYDEFSSQYLGTMGVRVNEKEIKQLETTVKLWDIAGEIHQEKVPKAYFIKKNIILYVVDISRPFTFKNIPTDLEYLKKHASESVIKVIGNKKDLLSTEELKHIKLPVTPDWMTSAKTGENIEKLFSGVVAELTVGNKK